MSKRSDGEVRHRIALLPLHASTHDALFTHVRLPCDDCVAADRARSQIRTSANKDSTDEGRSPTSRATQSPRPKRLERSMSSWEVRLPSDCYVIAT